MLLSFVCGACFTPFESKRGAHDDDEPTTGGDGSTVPPDAGTLDASKPGASMPEASAPDAATVTPDGGAPLSDSGAPKPARATCGNGVVEENEECDGDQACSVECLKVACGNARLDEGEECEPPAPGACSERCQIVRCGNGRVDPGEECEPPSVGSCTNDCLMAACKNGRIDPGEDCDPPLPGSCDSTCHAVECGNGKLEEGEGCEPPNSESCDAACHPTGCGDGKLSGSEECDPPAAKSCDGSCRRIQCGNARLDEGEACEPPSSTSCDASCQKIACGDGKVAGGEKCDPPRTGACNAQCQPIVCGDGRLDPGEQCEPTGSGDPACSSQCVRIDSTGTAYLFTFDKDVSGWTLYATSPERLASGSSVGFDAQNGDKSPGVLVLKAPFDASNQKLEAQATIPMTDMRDHTLRARVRLGSGLSSDTTNPGGIKLFAKAGDDFDYASGAWTYLRPDSGWQDITLECDAPVLIPGTFDAREVRQIGVELRAFSETTNVKAAVVYLDSISY
jgi:hypothetical protein